MKSLFLRRNAYSIGYVTILTLLLEVSLTDLGALLDFFRIDVRYPPSFSSSLSSSEDSIELFDSEELLDSEEL
jgi:hypothetical protein